MGRGRGGQPNPTPLSRARLSGWRPSLPPPPAGAPSGVEGGDEIALAGETPPTSPKLQPPHPRDLPAPLRLPSPIPPSPPESPRPGTELLLFLPGRSPRSSSLLRPGCPPATQGDLAHLPPCWTEVPSPGTGLLAWHGTARLGSAGLAAETGNGAGGAGTARRGGTEAEAVLPQEPTQLRGREGSAPPRPAWLPSCLPGAPKRDPPPLDRIKGSASLGSVLGLSWVHPSGKRRGRPRFTTPTEPHVYVVE